MGLSFRDALSGVAQTRPAVAKRTPGADQFHQSVQRAKDEAPATPPAQPVEAPPVYPWNSAPAGIVERKVETGVWPFRIYAQEGVDPKDNKALHDQLAATPQLDPKAFGNRPGAPADIDQGLEACDKVYVLDSDRLGLLEDQRKALATASDPKKSEAERDKAKDDLVVAIAQEVDHASQGQGAPSFGRDANGDGKLEGGEFSPLVAPIAERAPNDPVFLDALNQVREMKERSWKADGRTPDQLGKIAEAGDRGDYAAVTAETKRQLVALADGTEGPEAAKITALTKRAGIYQAYVGGDEKQYLAAVQEGTKQAVQELRVERPVRELQAAWGKGGTDGAKAFLAKLREKTDTKDSLPGSGSLLASDPRVQGLVDQSIDAIAGSKATGDDRRAQMQAMIDLGASCQTILYNDGDKAGAGKAFVDHVAARIVDKMNSDLPGDHLNLLHEQQFFSFMSREDTGGSGTSLLTAIAARTATLGADKRSELEGKGELGWNDYLSQNSNAQWAVRRSIEQFDAAATKQDDKINTLYNELYHGLSGWGGVKGDDPIPAADQLARDMEAIDKLPGNEQKARDLTKEGEKKLPQWERQESIQLALDLYKGDLKKVDGFDTEAPVPQLFGTGIMLTKSKSMKEAMDGLPELPKTKADPYANASTTDPAATGTIWVQRATRALATFAVVETMKGGVKDINKAMTENRYQAILRGDAVASRAEIDALQKYVKGGATVNPNEDFAKFFNGLKASMGQARLEDIIAGRAKPTDAEKRQMASADRLNIGTNAITRLSGGGSAILFGRNLGALDGSPADLVYYLPHTMMMLNAAQTALLPNAREILTGKDASVPGSLETRLKGAQARVAGSNLGPAQKALWGKSLGALDRLRGGGVDVLYVGADLSNAVMNGFGLAGTKQDFVKTAGYATATVSDAIFAASASTTLSSGAIADTALGRLITALGPLKVSGVAAVLQVAGAGIVQGRSAYNAAHTYDKADADAIQVLYGVKDRKVAEVLADHNDLLDEGLLGILQTVFPGDEHLMGGDELTRSAGNVLTGAYSDLDYTRARLGAIFNGWTPDQAEEVAKTVKDMTAKDGKLPDSQDDLKYLELPPDPTKADLSKYPGVTYNAGAKRYEDSATKMHWDGDRWWAPQKKVDGPIGPGSVPSQDPLWYDPKQQTLMHENGFAWHVKPDSKAGLKAWLQGKGYLD
ncbi:hypothetical protein [Inquilinus limosus]|uniref:hypothetical protein n=1 Tax=Inquilinus limosus TaxID=171674 RepID=UPI000B489CC3|nr:hypothetical protein [Inquilinus limosus]